MPPQETIEVKVGKMEVMLKTLHDRLIGGEGQKGVIQVHDEEIGTLQAWKNKASGAIAVIAFIVTALGVVRIIEAVWTKG